ncbi:AraC family transcriptional regulator [Alloalcanivorax xenomutans]|uniref:AraC family transcriptional regulator n=1 Tax=Alloalcanivorax xenomutans TaxID=1094342 RepID=A0A9Q3W7H7_9GAMM|nr:AraC family transcriptional regulator [Alloalcanivorax xenomutans]ARB46617.1 hypothetical protein P40_15375 [Alloalcanivorax xenomutans]MCE7510558.1 AraC family transcriptional regulator [Alloalcanivorax xenomutans]WOA30347.1 AraC family transcriptional regulator [Alloalcanivorax xenomutans]
MTTSADNYVAAAYVRLLYDYLESQGVEAETLLGAPTVLAEDGLEKVPLAFWRHSLEIASQHLDEPALGLAVARTITARHFDVLGYVVSHCGTLGEALARLERYHRLVYDVNPARVATVGDSLEVRWGVERGRPGALVDETGVAAVVQFIRNLVGRDLPVEAVHFVNPEPADLAPYRAFFGAEVRFDCARTVLRIPLTYLALPLGAPDPGLVDILDRQAQSLLERQPRAGSPYDAHLVRLMREGRPTLEALAERYHVSARTMQRRLAEQGETFQAVLQRVRYQLAREYLADGRLELTEVAALLGYSEHSAFTRAFRQWAGVGPKRWRREWVATSNPISWE